jgi:hypothetical protein
LKDETISKENYAKGVPGNEGKGTTFSFLNGIQRGREKGTKAEKPQRQKPGNQEEKMLKNDPGLGRGAEAISLFELLAPLISCALGVRFPRIDDK